LHELIEPHYPKVEGTDYPPFGLARMLRNTLLSNASACLTKASTTRFENENLST
jgi:hypothetical protein